MIGSVRTEVGRTSAASSGKLVRLTAQLEILAQQAWLFGIGFACAGDGDGLHHHARQRAFVERQYPPRQAGQISNDDRDVLGTAARQLDRLAAQVAFARPELKRSEPVRQAGRADQD